MLWALWWLLSSAVQVSATAPELRFHHIHVSVADPAAAMSDAAARLGAARSILQGHGPAVRWEGTYLVFDRSGDESGAVTGASAYLAAARWASERNLSISPMTPDGIGVIGALPAAHVTAIAFSLSNPAGFVQQLRARGTEPHDESPDVAHYRIAPGLDVEIVGETDRPDTHWCPMHPGIRSPGPARCGLCNMDLVPIPPPSIGEYVLDARLERPSGRRRAARLHLEVRDPRTKRRVTSFVETHERPLHLFIINRDLSTFAHLHPAPGEDGTFTIEHELGPGEYMLVADFLPAGGTPQMLHHAIVTPGYKKRAFSAAPGVLAPALEQVADGLHVRLHAAPLTALRPAALRFVVTDAASGGAVSDLEPYLGAAAHLLIVDPELTFALHAHPEGKSGGPELSFDPVLPLPGRYKMWLQLQRNGRVVTVPFVLEVAPL